MRVIVDLDLCECNALCVGLAPTIFELTDQDELRVLDEHPEDDLRADLLAAAAACPKQVITVAEE